MNIGTISRQALRVVAGESVENRLLVSKKIIREIEDTPSEASNRLCQALRATLKSIATDSTATGEQVRDSGSQLARVRAFDPRRHKSSPEDAAAPSKTSRGKGLKFDGEEWMKKQLNKNKTPDDPDYSRKLFEELKSRA